MAYVAPDNQLAYFKDTETGGTEKSAVKRVYSGLMLLYDRSVMSHKAAYGSSAIQPHSYLGHMDACSIPVTLHISWVPICWPDPARPDHFGHVRLHGHSRRPLRKLSFRRGRASR